MFEYLAYINMSIPLSANFSLFCLFVFIQVVACQRCFFAAYNTLMGDLSSCQGGVRNLAWLRKTPTEEEGEDVEVEDIQPLPVNNKNKKSTNKNKNNHQNNDSGIVINSNMISKYSRSFLGRLIDTTKLIKERYAHNDRCGRYPTLTLDERDSVGRKLLSEINDTFITNDAQKITFDIVEKVNPALACRLRSFASVEYALGLIRKKGNDNMNGNSFSYRNNNSYNNRGYQSNYLHQDNVFSSANNNNRRSSYPPGVVGNSYNSRNIVVSNNIRSSSNEDVSINSNSSSGKKRKRRSDGDGDSGSMNLSNFAKLQKEKKSFSTNYDDDDYTNYDSAYQGSSSKKRKNNSNKKKTVISKKGKSNRRKSI